MPPEQSTQSAATCRHPQLDTGDPTSGPTPPADGYVMRRNPFVYFEGITGSLDCAQNDVGLSQLTPDLQNPDQPQPAVSWIFPDLCQAGAGGRTPVLPFAKQVAGSSDGLIRNRHPFCLP